MRKATRISLALGTSAALLSFSALPASAVDGEIISTEVLAPTIEVTGNGMSISTSSQDEVSVVLSQVDETSTELMRAATIVIPDVTVRDLRAAVTGWTTSVQLTDFSTDDGVKLISAAGATYTSVIASPVSGDVTAAPPVGSGSLVAAEKGSSNEGKAVSEVITAKATGSNVVSWQATVRVNVPSTVLEDDYTAILTHSVI